MKKSSGKTEINRTIQLKQNKKFQWHKYLIELLILIAGISLLIGLWFLATVIGQYPTYILPDPISVYEEAIIFIQNGRLWFHIQATLSEMMGGLALGAFSATLMGYLLAKNQIIERLLGPYIVASQSIPVVAIAPLLIIWFGSGKLSKILICALIVFFPILVNTIVGIRSVDEGLKALMRSMRATRWQTFTMLEVPAALPVLLGGLKIGVTLSAIGAVVGEFVGADKGLGYLISLSKGLFNTPLMFVALITITGLSLILYLLVASLEKWLLAWRD